MHHIICKTLLLLSIILAIVATATPDWQVGTATLGNNATVGANQGLFKFCVSGKVDILNEENSAAGCHSFPSGVTSADKARKSCSALAVSAIVFLVVSLACDFIPQNELKYCRLIGLASFAIGVILMIACISLYADKVFKGWAQSSKELSAKSSYGYSFYLAISSLLLAAGSGVASVLKINL